MKKSLATTLMVLVSCALAQATPTLIAPSTIGVYESSPQQGANSPLNVAQAVSVTDSTNTFAMWYHDPVKGWINTSWEANSSGVDSGGTTHYNQPTFIVLDLGSVQAVDSLKIWNYYLDSSNRAYEAGTIQISYSDTLAGLTGHTYPDCKTALDCNGTGTPITDYMGMCPPNPSGPNYVYTTPDVISMGGVSARYIDIRILTKDVNGVDSGTGYGGYAGLGAVEVFQGAAAPEPATMSLLLMGGLVALKRRNG